MAAALMNDSASPTCHKRKRVEFEDQPLTPPLNASDPAATRFLSRAVHVLSTAATALSQVTVLYESDHHAREGLVRAVEAIAHSSQLDGKLIICGVGKSGLVGRKMVATMKSLGIASSFLHASEALHGDLGDIRKKDVVMFISYSGKTSELFALLPHIPQATPVLAITSHKRAEDCPLLQSHPNTILLPAPIHELEEVSFGVCAPTTSTTVTIAIGDMLALTVAEALHEMEEGGVKDVFKRNHPGGAIGAKVRKVEAEEVKEETGLVTPPGL